MTAPAWMPLYVADYIADTQHLGALEHGAYLMLIMQYWRTGSLPDDDKKLARIAKCSDREWRAIRSTIADLFDDGWSHKRIDFELEKARGKSEARADAGKRGGEAKALKSNDATLANARDLPQQKPALALASSSQSESEEKKEDTRLRALLSPEAEEGEGKKDAAYPPAFEVLWDCFPRSNNSSKLKAFKAWKALTSRQKDLCLDGVGPLIDEIELKRRSWPEFQACHLVTYINQRRWEALLEGAA